MHRTTSLAPVLQVLALATVVVLAPSLPVSAQTSNNPLLDAGYVTGTVACDVGGQVNIYTILPGQRNGCSDSVSGPSETLGVIDARPDEGPSPFPLPGHPIGFTVGHPDYDAEVLFSLGFDSDVSRLLEITELSIPPTFSVSINGQPLVGTSVVVSTSVIDMRIFVPTGQVLQYDGAMKVTLAPEFPVSCLGFKPPLDKGPVTVRGRNRALPLRASLFEFPEVPIRGEDLASPPVVQVLYSPEVLPDPMNISRHVFHHKDATEGNQFFFEEGCWQFNLEVRNLRARGTYLILMETGDEEEYLIEPTCEAAFVVD